jgi:hypothetical protein
LFLKLQKGFSALVVMIDPAFWRTGSNHSISKYRHSISKYRPYIIFHGATPEVFIHPHHRLLLLLGFGVVIVTALQYVRITGYNYNCK